MRTVIGRGLAALCVLALVAVPAPADLLPDLVPDALGQVLGEGDGGGAEPARLFADPVVVGLDDNGAWSWFSQERAAFDGCQLLVGSVADDGDGDPATPLPPGTGPSTPAPAPAGRIDVATLDTATLDVHVDTLMADGTYGDDHNAPALLPLGDGTVVAAWNNHNETAVTHVATRDADGRWQRRQDLTYPQPAVAGRTTYANLLPSPATGEVLNVSRSFPLPVVHASADGGVTWAEVGDLVHNDSARPYLRFAPDGDRRIWFVATDGHPGLGETGTTGLYAGYLDTVDRTVRRMDGEVVGRVARGTVDGEGRRIVAPSVARVTDLTPVAAPASGESRWHADMRLDPATGHPAIAWSVRRFDPAVPGDDGERRNMLSTWTGSGFSTEEIGFAGSALYPAQTDYTGLVALDPADHRRLVVSTDVHPATGQPLVSAADGQVHHELFEGHRMADGWRFYPLTADSDVDNLRPVIPAAPGPDGRTALVWFRGSYQQYFDYRTEVVAMVDRPTGDGGCPEGVPPRVDGQARPWDRVATVVDAVEQSVAISRATRDRGGAQHVLLGRADAFADSLAGTVLAGPGSPILLVPGGPDGQLPAVVAAELRRLASTAGGCLPDQVGVDQPTVTLLGGEQAISPAVAESVAALGWCVERVAGDTRITTAVAVADAAVARDGSPERVLLASAGGWADAVTAGVWAARDAVPVLLTDGEALHPAVSRWFDRTPGVQEVVIAGGEAVVSQAVVDQLAARGLAVRRIAGEDRTATAAAVARDLLGHGEGQPVALVDGYGPQAWAAALTTAPAAARDGRALLLANAASASAYTQAVMPPPAEVLVVGPVTALPDHVVAAHAR